MSKSIAHSHFVSVEDATAEAAALSINPSADRSGARAPLAALSMVRDSLHLLGAFAWGKEGRLSNKKSAQLCDLMNAWN